MRRHVLDPLTPTQLEQLRDIGDALLTRLDPDRRLTGLYDPVGEPPVIATHISSTQRSANPSSTRPRRTSSPR